MSRAKSTLRSNVSILNKGTNLDDLLATRPSGLVEAETWAVLCQSVQALQDLFLSDGLLGKQCIPLITPSTLMLSSKGRVKLCLTYSFVGSGPPPHLAGYLAPEYKVNKTYNDTEFEKMWIFSLGETLNRASLTSHSAVSRLSIEICQVLADMIRIQSSARSSLMHLLEVMSEYCKKRLQNRPFSHIIMDLHQEAFAGVETSLDTSLDLPAMHEIVPRHNNKTEQARITFETIPRRWPLPKPHDIPKTTKEVATSMEDLKIVFSNTPGKIERPRSLCVPVDNRYYQYVDKDNYFRDIRAGSANLGVSDIMYNYGLSNEDTNKIKEYEKRPYIQTDQRSKRHRVRRNPVQRAASRLYRTGIDLPSSKAGLANTCVGPEFVVKSSLPTKILIMPDSKGTRKVVTVIMLDGQKLDVTCNPNRTIASQLLDLIIQKEQIEENFLLGLSALIAGDFVFLPSDTRICKVIQPGSNSEVNLTLFLRVRFFLPSLRGIRGSQARHLLYLQLRRSILEHQLPCSFSQIIQLNGLALQAEFGNYNDIEHGSRDYFLLEHYVPETMMCTIDDQTRLRQELIAAHISKHGLEREKAEQDFIIFTQSLPHYGGHFYTATWILKDKKYKDIWLFISAQGLNIYERGTSTSHFGPQLYEMFEWKRVQTLCYSKHYLCIMPHSGVWHRFKLKKYKLQMDYKKMEEFTRINDPHDVNWDDVQCTYDIDSYTVVATSLRPFEPRFKLTISLAPERTKKCFNRKMINALNIPLDDDENSIWREFSLGGYGEERIHVLYRPRINHPPADIRLEFLNAIIRPAIESLPPRCNTKMRGGHIGEETSTFRSIEIFKSDWPDFATATTTLVEHFKPRSIMTLLFYHAAHGLLADPRDAAEAMKRFMNPDYRILLTQVHEGCVLSQEMTSLVVNLPKTAATYGNITQYKPYLLAEHGHFTCPGVEEPNISYLQSYDPESHVIKGKGQGSEFASFVVGSFSRSEKLDSIGKTIKHMAQLQDGFMVMLERPRKLRIEIVKNVLDPTNELRSEILEGKALGFILNNMKERNLIQGIPMEDWGKLVAKGESLRQPLVTARTSTTRLNTIQLLQVYDAHVATQYFLSGTVKDLDYTRLKSILYRDSIKISSMSNVVQLMPRPTPCSLENYRDYFADSSVKEAVKFIFDNASKLPPNLSPLENYIVTLGRYARNKCGLPTSQFSSADRAFSWESIQRKAQETIEGEHTWKIVVVEVTCLDEALDALKTPKHMMTTLAANSARLQLDEPENIRMITEFVKEHVDIFPRHLLRENMPPSNHWIRISNEPQEVLLTQHSAQNSRLRRLTNLRQYNRTATETIIDEDVPTDDESPVPVFEETGTTIKQRTEPCTEERTNVDPIDEMGDAHDSQTKITQFFTKTHMQSGCDELPVPSIGESSSAGPSHGTTSTAGPSTAGPPTAAFPAAMKRSRTTFSPHDDMKLCRFLLRENNYTRTGGTKLWEKAVQSVFPGFSALGLKRRSKTLRKNQFKNVNLTAAEKSLLMKNVK